MLNLSLSKKLILFILVYTSNILALRPIDGQLMQAATIGDLEQIDNLINQGADVNIKIGGTPLIMAVWRNNLGIVNRLLKESKINIYEKDDLGYTALGIAKLYNHDGITRAIINSKHFDIKNFLETVSQDEKEGWINYIYEQQAQIAEKKLKELTKKHGSVIRYLEKRELCPSRILT